MKFSKRERSRLTTSEMRWSCSSAMRSKLAAPSMHLGRRMRRLDIVGIGRAKGDELFARTCPPAASEYPGGSRAHEEKQSGHPLCRFVVLSHADDQFSSRMLLLQISQRIGYLAQ